MGTMLLADQVDGTCRRLDAAALWHNSLVYGRVIVFSSGMTGDGSSIAIRNVATTDMETLRLQMQWVKDSSAWTSQQGLPDLKTRQVAQALSAVANRPAVRGQASTPAIVTGNQMV